MITTFELVMPRPHIDDALQCLTISQLNDQKIFIREILEKKPKDQYNEDQLRYLPYRKWLAFYYSRILDRLNESDDIIDKFRPFKAMSSPSWIGDKAFHSRCREVLTLENL